MRFILLILVCIFFIDSESSAQVDIGDAHDNFLDENYEVALRFYKRLHRRFKDDPLVNYRMGLSYLYCNEDKTEAIPHLEFVDTIAPGMFPSIKFDLAKAYFFDFRFDTAIHLANNYLNSANLNERNASEVRRFIEICDNAKVFVANPKNVLFENLGESINSKTDDYNPFITEDEQILYFSSNRRYSNDWQVYMRGIYFSLKENSRWGRARSAGSRINTDENEELVGISKDGNTILVHVDRLNAPNDLYYSTRQRNRFTELVSMGRTINSRQAEMGASLSKEEDTLYFASNRPGGFGGFDIYMSIKLPNGEWGIPQNLGEPINTPYDENFPYISASGNQLYFSSNGHNTMGGYDVFVSEFEEEGWGNPVNLGYPINDLYDNYNIVYTTNRRYGYLSRFDKDGVGGLDIYRVVMKDVPPTNIVYLGNVLLDFESGKVPIHEVDEIYNTVSFSVNCFDTGDEIGIVAINARNSKYTYALQPGKFRINIIGDMFEEYDKVITIADEQPLETVIIEDIVLKPKK